MSFNDMMQEAIKIRTNTDATLRADFDARPTFQQNSMFATKEVCEARELPLEERVAKCTAMKLEGNNQIRSGQFAEACHTYEQALAIFWYLHNENEGWKNSGIKDEDIKEVNFSPANSPEESEKIRDLKVALLLNIARACSARNDHTSSRKACSAALTINPKSAKALFWRGKGLVSPASAGAFETEEAIRDVSRAAELAPSDGVIRAFLLKLKAEKAEQRKTDRATYAGLFRRGSVCAVGEEVPARPNHPPPSHDENAGKRLPVRGKANGGEGVRIVEAPVGGDSAGGRCTRVRANVMETRQDVENRVAFLERLAEECDAEDREEEAAGYRERVAAVLEALAKHDEEQKRAPGDGTHRAAGGLRAHGVDWRNPSEAMRKKAQDDELDLANPAVMSFLLKMQEVHRKKEEMRRNKTGHTGQEDSEKHDGSSTDAELENEEAWSRETWEGAILCMSRTEVTSLLSDSGIEPATGMTLKDLRQTAVQKLLGNQSPAGTDESAAERKRRSKRITKPKRVDWRLSMAITLAIFLFKSYQMGVFKLLATGLPSGPGPAPKPTVSRSEWQQRGEGRQSRRREGGAGGGRTEEGSSFSGDSWTTGAATGGAAAYTGGGIAANILPTGNSVDEGAGIDEIVDSFAAAGSSLAAKTLASAATATVAATLTGAGAGAGGNGDSLAAKALSASVSSMSAGCTDFDGSSSGGSRSGSSSSGSSSSGSRGSDWVVDSCRGGDRGGEGNDEFAPFERI